MNATEIACSTLLRYVGLPASHKSSLPPSGSFSIIGSHTFEVAQFGQRLTQKLLRELPPNVVRAIGGLDPDVVEAAALAHDLGHPPFGHVAEQELDSLVKQRFPDGFNGNAQSFRIVSKLAVRRDNIVGLNLTRATLNAILKYPWKRDLTGTRNKKWGYYRCTENEEFKWARRGTIVSGPDDRTAEAEIVNWADDVVYAVHDLEDFYRAGLIPLDRLVRDSIEVDRFITSELSRLKEESELKRSEQELTDAFKELFSILNIMDRFSGTRLQRADLRRITSTLISGYVDAFSFKLTPSGGWEVVIDPIKQAEIIMLKRLTWHYVIYNPSLATLQYGYRKIIQDLYRVFIDAATKDGDFHIFPPRFLELIDDAKDEEEKTRVVVDLITSMTEHQAIDVHARLMGRSNGSAFDPLGP